MSETRKPDFGPIKAKRVFEVICERIRGEIASGALRPGDKLPPERELAEQFNVSRTAVREAFRSLEIAGLVGLQKGAKGGAFILDGNPTLTRSLQDMISLGRISLADLTEARVLIQESIVRLACARATEADYEALERDISEVEALTRSGHLRDRLSYSINFYKILANITKNQVMIILIDSVTYILRLVVNEVGPDPKLDLAETRRAFMKCMRARDADGAVREMTAHLQRLHDHLDRARRKPSTRAARIPASADT